MLVQGSLWYEKEGRNERHGIGLTPGIRSQQKVQQWEQEEESGRNKVYSSIHK